MIMSVALGMSTPTSITCGRNEHRDLAPPEFIHDHYAFIGLQPPVDHRDADFGKSARYLLINFLHRFQVQFFRLFDDRADNEHLPTFSQIAGNEFVRLRPLFFVHDPGHDRSAPRRLFVEHRNIKIAVQGQGQGPRDRGRGKDQKIGV